MLQRILPALALLSLPLTPAAAQQAELKIGDPAPALQVGKWVQGTPIAGAEAGKITVVEFWATWCGPCIAGMPHLSEVQERYAKDGLRVVSVSRPDPNNTLEKVEAMVQDKQAVMRYAVAWDAEGVTYAAYMTAAKQRGIPACFVLDGAGRVAWIGHPFFLDLVLPDVIGGSWDLAKSPAAVAAKISEFRSLSQSAAARPRDREAEALLARLDAFRAANAVFGANLDETRYHLLDDAGRRDEAHLLGLGLAKRWAAAGSAEELNSLAWTIVSPETLNPDRDLALALYAATAAVQIGRWKEPNSLDTLARTHWVMGDRARAVELQKQAVSAAEGVSTSAQRDELSRTLTEYESAKP